MVNESPPEEASGQKSGAKKIFCILTVVILIILLLAGLAIWYFFFHLRAAKNTSQTNSGELSVQPAEIDRERAVVKTFGPDGGVMTTRAADGTLYSLTVPSDALILPSQVSMSPLKSLPIKNYQNAEAGQGVFLDGKFSFIRPAFLTIQPNTEMPSGLDKTGAVKWGRCKIVSRGFDPEICAGLRKIPFNGGVEAEKVVIAVDADNDTILLNPTIAIGQTNVYSAHVWGKGAFLADKITKSEAETLARLTYNKSYDYVNQSEVLMHLLMLGGDLSSYKEQISRFAREKKDYPREVLKGAIIALVVDDQESYQQRIEDFQNKIEQNIGRARGSVLPLPRYVVLLKQIEADLANKPATSWNLIGRVMAAEIKCTESEAPAEEQPNWDGLDISNWPPQLQDYDETAANQATNNWLEDMNNRSRQMLRNILGSSIYSCAEKAWAAEALQNLGGLDADDCAAIKQILSQCADKCATLEECEKQGDAAHKYNDRDAIASVNYRITAFLESGLDCTSPTKKNLKTYGQNFCQGAEEQK